MNSPLFIGQNLRELTDIDSTNNYLKDLLTKDRPAEGTAVLAQYQSSGRGQRGNTWESEPGKNLVVSYVLYPTFLEAAKQFYLSMAISLAVKDCCEALLKDEVKVKWPNDIFHGDKKIGGILIENSIAGSALSSSIIGIGLNVNQTEFSTSASRASSLKSIAGKPFEVKAVFYALSGCIEKYYLQLKQSHLNFLEKAYTTALYRYQQTHEFRKGTQILKGEIDGVTKEGKLIVHCNGKEQRFNFKEIEYLWE